MKRRNRMLLMWMLTGIWLCVQSPWAHAQRTHLHAHATVEIIAAHVGVPHAGQHESAPCHGVAEQPAPVDAIDADAADCCDGGQCDGQCAHLLWALTAPVPLWMARATGPLIPIPLAGIRSLRHPELFRPPI